MNSEFDNKIVNETPKLKTFFIAGGKFETF